MCLPVLGDEIIAFLLVWERRVSLLNFVNNVHRDTLRKGFEGECFFVHSARDGAYLTGFDYIFVGNAFISDVGTFEAGQVHLLHSTDIHSHDCILFLFSFLLRLIL